MGGEIMYQVKVVVTLKESILDPTGIATKDGLNKLGFEGVREVRVGKVLYLTIVKTENIEDKIKEMCEKLLVNEVMEEYSYEIEGRYS
jgi:phosphoribosylformylglycinamidine synthase